MEKYGTVRQATDTIQYGICPLLRFSIDLMLLAALWIRLPLTETSKVKVTLVQALNTCTGRTAHRGSRGIALLF